MDKPLLTCSFECLRELNRRANSGGIDGVDRLNQVPHVAAGELSTNYRPRSRWGPPLKSRCRSTTYRHGVEGRSRLCGGACVSVRPTGVEGNRRCAGSAPACNVRLTRRTFSPACTGGYARKRLGGVQGYRSSASDKRESAIGDLSDMA